MWQFRKKEPKRNITIDAISKLREFCEIGDSFMYLGRKCVVTGHVAFMHGSFVPLLQFDYCDDIGVLHHGSATILEIEAFRRNPNAQ